MSSDHSGGPDASLPSSSSPPLSASSHPTPDELTRIARQEALLDRLMERKLAMLEADYQETINAEIRATARSHLTSPDVAHAAGYINASDLPHHVGYTQHGEGEGGVE